MLVVYRYRQSHLHNVGKAPLLLKIVNHFFQGIGAEKSRIRCILATESVYFCSYLLCFVTRQTEYTKEMHNRLVSSSLYKTVSLIVPQVYSVQKFSSLSPVFFTISSHQELHACSSVSSM